jgi:hypothetical protein
MEEWRLPRLARTSAARSASTRAREKKRFCANIQEETLLQASPQPMALRSGFQTPHSLSHHPSRDRTARPYCTQGESYRQRSPQAVELEVVIRGSLHCSIRGGCACHHRLHRRSDCRKSRQGQNRQVQATSGESGMKAAENLG